MTDSNKIEEKRSTTNDMTDSNKIEEDKAIGCNHEHSDTFMDCAAWEFMQQSYRRSQHPDKRVDSNCCGCGESMLWGR
jgi:hypothetical protein